MCISIPGQVEAIVDPAHRLARVVVGGRARVVNLSLLPPEAGAVGNWVLVQAGLAVQALSPEDAQSALDFLRELDQLNEEAET